MKLKENIKTFFKRHKKIYAIMRVIKMPIDNEIIELLTSDNNLLNIVVHEKNSDDVSIVYYYNRTRGKDEGFFALLRTTLYCLHYANRFNFEPYIKWPIDCQYFDNELGNNPFEYYFKQICEDTEENIIKKRNIVFFKPKDEDELKKYSLEMPYYDNDNFIMEMAKLWRDNLKLKEDVRLKLDREISGLFKGRVLGIHYRGTDFKQNFDKHPISLDVEDYFYVLDNELNIKNYDFIFIATDDLEALEKFKERYGNKLIFFDDTLRAKGNISAMYLKADRPNNNFLKGYEVLRDGYALARTNGLVTGKSMVSMFARVIAEVEENKFDVDRILSKGINKNSNIFIAMK